MGMPGEGYPWRWSVYEWLMGENAALDRLADPDQAALDLAAFVRAVHDIDTTGGPRPGTHNSSRGVPLIERDSAVRTALASLEDELDIGAVSACWEAALAAPVWEGPPVWIHGDLQPGNLLAQNGRLSAVIDWGCLGVGDPACDLLAAWNLFSDHSRETYRETLGMDEASWERGRGWALSMAVIALPYYRDTNPELAGMAKKMVDEVLSVEY
jgi:aminoglycoside phosphotransferase (APT) family kinase protein